MFGRELVKYILYNIKRNTNFDFLLIYYLEVDKHESINERILTVYFIYLNEIFKQLLKLQFGIG